jgi:hypothetical protein
MSCEVSPKFILRACVLLDRNPPTASCPRCSKVVQAKLGRALRCDGFGGFGRSTCIPSIRLLSSIAQGRRCKQGLVELGIQGSNFGDKKKGSDGTLSRILRFISVGFFDLRLW